MVSKQYGIIAVNVKVPFDRMAEIKKGCSVTGQFERDFTYIEQIFTEKQDALDALLYYRADGREMNDYFRLTEYYVSDILYDESHTFKNNGEVIKPMQIGDLVFATGEMKIGIMADFGKQFIFGNLVATFDNYKDAQNALSAYADGQIEFLDADELPTIKQLRQMYNISQKEIAAFFDIPLRTIQNWEYGTRACAPYIIKMMVYKLENESKKRT